MQMRNTIIVHFKFTLYHSVIIFILEDEMKFRRLGFYFHITLIRDENIVPEYEKKLLN